MCYAVSLRKEEQVVEQRFNAEMAIPLLYEPYHYQSGFKHQNLFIITQQYPHLIYPAMWGLVPSFVKGDVTEFLKTTNTLNARSESVYEKASYKKSIVDKRCIILADGFFEPHHRNNVSYPFYCQLKERKLFGFAGIYTQLDEEVFSCSILTLEANEFFAEIHNVKKRMPLVLDEEFEDEWLRSDLKRTHIQELMRVGFTKEEFEAYPVSKEIYRPGFNGYSPLATRKKEYNELTNEQGNLFN